MAQDPPFWETKSLSAMSAQEWESLCDGCGKCCLGMVNDPDGGPDLKHTDVACRLLDPYACRCSSYADRHRFVPDCVRLKPKKISKLTWLPASCAYKRLARGAGLADWHPLVGGDPESVHTSGNSVRGRTVSERKVTNFNDHIVDWLS